MEKKIYGRTMTRQAVNPSSGLNAGGAVLLMIITVLCLSIFGVLTFVSAFSDRKLAEKTRESSSQYYLAEKQMEADLSVLDEALKERDDDILLSVKLSDVIKALTDGEASSKNGIITITNTVRYSENRKLTAIVEINENRDKTSGYKIISWRSLPVVVPDYGQDIDLWDGVS